MKEVHISSGMVALVDDEDFELVSQYNWHCALRGNVRYARTNMPGSRKKVYMHRLVMNLLDATPILDHVNRDGLDNRKENLRLSNSKLNQQNRGKRRKSFTSKYKGVSWKKSSKKWRAQITTGGKKKHLGYFSEELDAAQAYNEAAKKYFKDMACINDLV